jgi:hypothetical protein
MKSQISRQSHDPSKRYSGVFQQQGRMITDADWNELQAIVRARLDEALRDIVGGGVPRARPLGLRFNQSQLEIVPGVLYAGGLSARLGTPGSAVFTYASQPDFPSAPGTVALNDVLYVDAWEREVSYLEDPALQDPGLNGADTCTRSQTMLQIKRAPAGFAPESDPRNPATGNALLGIGLRRAQASTDVLDPRADEVAIDQPIGNFLFRVEVHDVQGPANNPTSITLKWSSENGAEAFASASAPADYKSSDFAYEFHGPKSEKELGVQLVAYPPRRPLDDGYPATEPDRTELPWVRRWDGFCVLTRPNGSADWTNASIVSGKDRGVALGTAIADGIHGHAGILASPATGTPTSLILRLNLQLVDLQLHLKGYSFVAGDYWLATARDAFASGQQLLDSKPPLGVVHRYLQLGKVIAGQTQGTLAFQPDRSLAFPSLADLVADAPGAAGAGRIGAEAVSGAPNALAAGSVGTQLASLLAQLNQSVQRAETRYLRKAASLTVQLDNNTPKAVFTSLNAPAAVTFTYCEFDGATPKSLQQFANGPKTSQIEVRIDKDNQKGVGGITTDVFWHHVFVTNRTNTKIQVTLDVFMTAPPANPEKGGDKEGKDTNVEKSDTEKTNKDAKDGKDTPDKSGKETKESKETKEGKDSTEKTEKERKDGPDKTNKESKETKEGKDSKEQKEQKEAVDKVSKENKEQKEAKESKESTKESKEKEASKDSKDRKETKEDTDKAREKGGFIGAIEKQIDQPAPAPGLPATFALDAAELGPASDAVDDLPLEQLAFIRADERPPVGDALARRPRAEAPSA